MREFQRAAAGLGRVQELLAIQPVFVDGEGIPLPAGPLAVEFDHVWFTYDASADRGSAFAVEDEVDYTLRDITLRLEEGRVLGLLGRTGSGKTTMTRLLFRLYDITRGGLRVGDVDVRDARLAELRQRIGLVTQEVQLFQASVRDNLTFFDPAIPDERILAVLDNLGLGEWYVGLAEGLDTELSAGGGGLSAGQAQLLAFARVFLRDPGLVILDEASSRLDPATETLIERAVDKLLQGRTAIIIAHRLGTVQRADEIVILDGGQVVEHGPRAYLAADPASRFATLLRTGLEEVLA